MDENKSPQDFLNEIFERTQAAAPPMPPPRFEPPGDDPPPAPLPDGPAETRGTETGAKLLPWLCVALGAALLVMAVCLLQLVRMNHRLDGLQQAVEAVQSVDSLREENELLQELLDQAELRSDLRQQMCDDAITRLSTVSAQKRWLDYVWYMGQFMEHGDYPMAALVAVLSAEKYFPDSSIADPQAVYLNPEHTAQYRVYCRELADKGYLGLTSSTPLTVPIFPEQWDPEQDPDMAALGILWCALDAYYVTGVPELAAQYLIRYQWYELYSPGEWESGGDCYPQRILDTASDYTIRLYERLVQDLIASGWVIETDGTLLYNEDRGSSDVLYGLPFDPPGGYVYGQIPLG